MSDVVKEPEHCKYGKIETIECIESIVAAYTDPIIAGLIWQNVKYMARAPLKGTELQDLKKGYQYLGRAIAKMEGREGWE